MSISRKHHIRRNNQDVRKLKINDEVEDGFKNLLEALALIKKMPGDKGKIKCPKCGNDLHWTRASTNKHVWGKCKTENCLSWMQ